MNPFDKSKYKRFSDLPLNEFNATDSYVYIIDFKWNYLFVNDAVKKNLGARATDLIGKNMWTEFVELARDPVFNSLKDNMDNRMAVSIVTTSPITRQRLNIYGCPLEDCFYFESMLMPKKEELMNELGF